ncbi:MAG: ATP-binding protein [Floccifex sp.]
MNIQQAKLEIKHTVQAYLQKDEDGNYIIPSIRQRPILLIGPPGIGKTQIMEQIAKECQIGLVSYTITHHTRQSAVGLPFISKEEFDGKEYTVTEYTMSEIIASIYQKMRDTNVKEGILFIDEINCVSETLAPTMLQFLQGKTFGNQPIPKGWIIAGAGNPSEYNKSVREFDMVTLDRVRYLDVQQDYYAWKEYAINQGIHPCILGYLELKPSHFYCVENDIDGLKFVTARGWEDLSHLIKSYESLHISITKDIVYEYLHHDEISEDFASYYLLFKKYQESYGVEDILNGNITSKHYARVFDAAFDERLAVVNLLLDGLKQKVQQFDETQSFLDFWFSFLKEFKQRETTLSMYHQMLQEKLQFFQLAFQQERIDVHELSLKKKWIQKMDVSFSEKDVFEDAKMKFMFIQNELENLENQLLDSMNSCFEFLLNAFNQGQEMVVFVTGLSLHSKLAYFLAQHEVKAYDEYKDVLLLSKIKQELLDILNHSDVE